MVFSSIPFLYYFLPCVLTVYFAETEEYSASHHKPYFLCLG